MANYQTKLTEELNEQLLDFTESEDGGKTPYQMRNENNDFELNEVKRVIVHLIREIREERAVSRKETKDLLNYTMEIKEVLAISRKEIKDLREGINGIKEEIHYLRNKLLEINTLSPPNNRKYNSQDDTDKSKEGNRV
jgi:polyhydroxyalkanoate synthesis regulator phasin